jgi:hypothetical protein
MAHEDAQPIYWDASAVLSVLISDVHSAKATATARGAGTHLLSTLGYAEAFAVIARFERDGTLPAVLAGAAREVIVNGPWRRLALQPDWTAIEGLAPRWPVRGADLWHLATAETLRRQLPELQMITFDARLMLASQEMGLPVIS